MRAKSIILAAVAILIGLMQSGEARSCPVLNIGTSPQKPTTMSDVVRKGIVSYRYIESSPETKIIDASQNLFYLYIINFNQNIHVNPTALTLRKACSR